LVSDNALWHDLIRRGKSRLAELPSAEEQYELDLQCFRDVLNGRSNATDC
jgi:hypothetical protein